MYRGVSAWNLLPLTVLLGCCVMLSSAAVIPYPRTPNRFWKRELPKYPANVQLRGPFFPGMLLWALHPPSPVLYDWSPQITASDMMPIQAGKVHFDSDGDPRKLEVGKRRSIVVADDAAFREKSRLLTAMERKKWLNAYMQKLLVVN
uniref:Tuberoinfundibular peptide of 39 residues n=1 Tax=Geotrypetes seraphini TaxID=260995 RepID=A0A6P8SCV5_GEOSA|nr:tuberoinfundibular peptide of 39 residues [Geotrypetes seraphini]XP_033816027.1 tuberoinfundibular peptide of 39 residues [Geotrypetes seraphini]XP_033816028.1 tuberoinfundibular peptide of 39 residues [Geotrypetes seraphini]